MMTKISTVLVAGLLALPAAAQEWSGAPHPQTPKAPETSSPQVDSGDQAPAKRARGAREYFTDVVLTDQNGQPQRLYSDMLEGKVVLINSMFTSCTGTCPAMAGRMLKVQEWLGDRLGKQVYMVSISVDPENDTPERMKEFADRFGAKPGWYFLTGKPENVDFALHKIGQFVDDPESHMSVMIAGNEVTGLWKKIFGLSKPEEIIAILETVLEDDGAAG